MSKFASPIKEIEYTIGVLYELSLHTNLQLTDSVNNLRITVGNLIAAETQLQDINLAHNTIETKYKALSKL